MYWDDQTTELEVLVKEYLAGQGLVLVELICRRQGQGKILQILVDQPEGGISIDTCARLNRELGAILDEKDILGERYILEVASPGLDRPLKIKADFLRCLKKEAVFYLSGPLKGSIQWQGVIESVTEETVFIEKSGERVGIPLNLINRAKQIIKNI